MVGMLVGLQAIANLRQRDIVLHGCSHQIRSQVNQQFGINQDRATFTQIGTTSNARSLTVVTGAERIGIAFRGRCTQKLKLHERLAVLAM
jgi:hypothetical protein